VCQEISLRNNLAYRTVCTHITQLADQYRYYDENIKKFEEGFGYMDGSITAKDAIEVANKTLQETNSKGPSEHVQRNTEKKEKAPGKVHRRDRNIDAKPRCSSAKVQRNSKGK
jgi:hypothetical protein